MDFYNSLREFYQNGVSSFKNTFYGIPDLIKLPTLEQRLCFAEAPQNSTQEVMPTLKDIVSSYAPFGTYFSKSTIKGKGVTVGGNDKARIMYTHNGVNKKGKHLSITFRPEHAKYSLPSYVKQKLSQAGFEPSTSMVNKIVSEIEKRMAVDNH